MKKKARRKLRNQFVAVLVMISVFMFSVQANAMVTKYIGNNQRDYKVDEKTTDYGSSDVFTGSDNMKSGTIKICGVSYKAGGNISSTKKNDSGLIKLSVKKLDLDSLTKQFGQNVGSWIYNKLSNAKVVSSSGGSYRYIHVSSSESPCGENIELTTSDVSAPKFVKAVYEITPITFYDSDLDENGKVVNVKVGSNYKLAVCVKPNPDSPFTAKQKSWYKNEVITDSSHKFEITDKSKISTVYQYRCAGEYNVKVTLYDDAGNKTVKTFVSKIDALMIKRDPDYEEKPKNGGLVIRE